MKILFIQNNIVNESIPLMELSALLKKNGHEAEILIEDEEPDFCQEVIRTEPDMYLIPCPIMSSDWVLSISRKLKDLLPKIIVVVGIYPTLFPHFIENDTVDMLCIGEAEFAVLELVECISKKQDLSSVSNLIYKKNGKIVSNPLMPLLDDLDTMPLPDRSLYYKRYKIMANMGLKRFLSSRGCFYNCAYCFNSSLHSLYKEKGKMIRKKTPQRVIDEIIGVKSEYGLTRVHFSDDMFPLNKAWVLEFAGLYKDKVNLPYTFNARVDILDREMLSGLRESGCEGIAVGIESGNEQLRTKIMNKHISNDDIMEKCGIIRSLGMRLATFNMIGTPDETIDNIFESIELNRKICPDSVRTTIPVVFPKTEFYNIAVKNGFLPDDNRFLESFVFEKGKSRLSKILRLYYLFSFFVCAPFSLRMAKFLISLPLGPCYSLIRKSVFLLSEKRFFGVSFLEGADYMRHVKSLKKRHKFYPSYL